MKNAKLLAALAVGTLTLSATSAAQAKPGDQFGRDITNNVNNGTIVEIGQANVNLNAGGGSEGGSSSSSSGSGYRPALAGVPDLTNGMSAPGLDVGQDDVKKATVTYSNSIGSNDSFSVGASTNIGATASATSTPDYDVSSTSTFGIGGGTGANASTINQTIGTGGDLPNAAASITGKFTKKYTANDIDNEVTVGGIGTAASIEAGSSTNFTTDIAKTPVPTGGSPLNTGAGSANGSAAGSVGTTTTASASSSQFVSSFAQAY